MTSDNLASIIAKAPNKETEGAATLVFVISAFEDFPQLQALIHAIHLPHHWLIVHLERQTGPSYVAQVQSLTKIYSNLVVLQFGTVIYPGDSLSQINFAIMQLLEEAAHVHDDFHYDYLLALSAASYPLYSAEGLARYLYKAPKRVRLGLLQGGDPRLCRRRAASVGLYYTRGGQQKRRVADIYDIHNVLSEIMEDHHSNNQTTMPLTAALFAPKGLKQTCRRKTTSGNTAAYDRNAIQKITRSATVKDYMARFKLAGQCCVEESSWGAALHVIGRSQGEVPLPGIMWQAWPCGMGMGNSYLVDPAASSSAPTHCLRMDDKSVFPEGPVELRTPNEIEKALIHGKQQGHLFARKFHSTDQYWMKWIQTNLHNQHEPATPT
ncbi:expressed unknown protein [Seminavis robusta]|uniref:Uncharacterized protein n=1 Tax=Seminavis robusta TaxID=568900 RepID=A0A9N8HQY8_9STRA|nr:expressed unknown protein [Seminavis robusta]|eukprot:Sro1254_g256450.1 n/a (380) ;mRNA; r:29479-30618